jgi:eight-cysteine-cluster-containing protein
MKYALLVFLLACGNKSTPPSDPGTGTGSQPAANDCIKTGCSGIVCAEPGKDVITTCEYKAEYACYRDAACERQADGSCGWTQSQTLTACLANPPPIEAGGAPQ